MKRKNAFTLIELLAVIVVLAIIALIATPIVMNTIKKSKKGAAERSVDNYIDAVETTVATKRLDNVILEGEYIIQLDGSLCPLSGCGENDKDKVIIEMEGNKPSGGTITINNGQVTNNSTMTIGEYDVSYDETTKKYTATKLETYSIKYNLTNVSGDNNNGSSITTKGVKVLKFTANSGYVLPDSVTVAGATSVWDKTTGTLTLSKVTGDVNVTIIGEEMPPYTNGEVVYFNVTTGEKCSSSDYTETQSNTGTKSGCMKFYAFNDDGKDTVNLILDHNTTAKVAWNNTYKNDSGSIINAKGPKELLDQLKTDTSSWKGTETPTNYTLDQTRRTSKAKYTIDYSEYKARLITAQEIATITGHTDWNESYYHLESKSSSQQSPTCRSGNTTGCKYGWLYDRTKTNCTTYGCLNNSDISASYWTASSVAGSSDSAWIVTFAISVTQDGRFYAAVVEDNTVSLSSQGGVRPVIEVLRSKLK